MGSESASWIPDSYDTAYFVAPDETVVVAAIGVPGFANLPDYSSVSDHSVLASVGGALQWDSLSVYAKEVAPYLTLDLSQISDFATSDYVLRAPSEPQIISPSTTGFTPLVVVGNDAVDIQQWKSSSGSVVANIDPDGYGVFTKVHVMQGSSSYPSIARNTDPDTGINLDGSGVVQIVVDGDVAAKIDSLTGITMYGLPFLDYIQTWVSEYGYELGHINSQGRFRGPLGDAGSPTYSFVDDWTSGMYLLGSGVISIAASKSDVIVIDPSRVEIQGGVDFRFRSYGSAAKPIFGLDGAGIYFPDPYTFAISTDGGEVFRVGSDGSVGIGTSSPTAMLDVSTNSAFKPGLVVHGYMNQYTQLQRWVDYNGNTLASVDKDGRAYFGKIYVGYDYKGYPAIASSYGALTTGIDFGSDSSIQLYAGGYERFRVTYGKPIVVLPEPSQTFNSIDIVDDLEIPVLSISAPISFGKAGSYVDVSLYSPILGDNITLNALFGWLDITQKHTKFGLKIEEPVSAQELVFGVDSSSGAGIVAISGNYNLQLGTGSGQASLSTVSQVSILGGAGVKVTTADSREPSLIVCGVDGQTANLQEWQDSTGVSLASLDYNGAFILTPQTSPSDFQFKIVDSSGLVGVGVGKEIGTQLPELLVVNPDSRLIQGDIVKFRGYASSYITLEQTHTPPLNSGLDSPGLKFVGKWNQDGTIYDIWQTIKLQPVGPYAYKMGIGSYGATQFAITIFRDENRVPKVGINQDAPLAQLHINPNYEGQKGVIVQGYSGQIANLTEWQDSVGTVLSAVDANGNVGIGGDNPTRKLTVFTGTSLNDGVQVISQSGKFINLRVHDNAGPYIEFSNDLVISNTAIENARFSNAGDFYSAGNITVGTTNSASQNRVNKLNVVGNAAIGSNFYSSAAPTDGLIIEGNVGVGTASPTSKFHVVTDDVTKIPAVIQGAPSQSVNLQEWQDSTGTVLAHIDSGGHVYIGDRTNKRNVYAAQIREVGGASSLLDFTNPNDPKLSGYTSLTLQTGGGGGDILFNPNYTEAMRIASGGNVGIGTTAPEGRLHILNGEGTVPILIVQEPADQTENLTEWRGSSGTILCSVDKYGHMVAPSFYVGSGAVQVTSDGGKLRLYGNQGFKISHWGSSGYVDDVYVSPSGDVGVGTTTPGGRFHVLNSDAAVTALVIQRAASQTANIVEWKDETGVTLGYIDYDGRVTLPTFGALSWGNSSYSITGQGGGTKFQIKSWEKPIHFVSQAGTNLVIEHDTGNVGIGTTTPSARLHTQLTDSASVGLIVQGAASQTANLQEWQDSTGTVLAHIDSSGTAKVVGAYIYSTQDPANDYVVFSGVSSDGRQQMVAYSNERGTYRVLQYNGRAATFGGASYAFGDALQGNMYAAGDEAVYTGGVIFGTARPDQGFLSGGSGTGLYFGLPDRVVRQGYGDASDPAIDLGTFRTIGNTYGGVRPGIRYTGKYHDFRVSEDDGRYNNGTTGILLSSSGININLSTTFPGGLRLLGMTTSASDPTTTEVPNDKDTAIHKNTTTGDVYLVYNDGGVVKKILFT